MQRVIGLGGVFFKAKDPKALHQWYRDHLGLSVGNDGSAVLPFGGDGDSGYAVWAAFRDDTKYFEPSKSPFMVNFRVADLTALLSALRAEGCDVADKMEDSEYGKFGWVMDPEGNRVELWEPPKEEQQG